MRITIAVPCMDQVPAPFAQSLAMLQKVGECKLAFQMGSLIYTSRNALARMAIENESDYILWLDSDMVFDPDQLVRMVDYCQQTGEQFLTAIYYRRVPPHTPVLFKDLTMKDGICEWTEFDEIPKRPFEVGGCGFGGVLLDTEVVMSVMAKYNEMFEPINRCGEDLAFCWRARECGYRIICDPSIKMGHVGYIMADERYYEAYKKSRERT